MSDADAALALVPSTELVLNSEHSCDGGGGQRRHFWEYQHHQFNTRIYKIHLVLDSTGNGHAPGHLPFFLSDPPRVRRFQDTGHGHIPDAENQLEICQCQYSKHSKGAIKPINLASSSLYPPFTLF